MIALALLALVALLQPHSAWPSAVSALSVSSAHSPSVHVERMLLQRALPRAPHSDDPRRPVATAEEAEQFESRSFSVAVFSVAVDDAAELYATDTASGGQSRRPSRQVQGAAQCRSSAVVPYRISAHLSVRSLLCLSVWSLCLQS